MFFLFLIIRRPPRSTRTDTLFPYTTLFRSLLHLARRQGIGVVQQPPDQGRLAVIDVPDDHDAVQRARAVGFGFRQELAGQGFRRQRGGTVFLHLRTALPYMYTVARSRSTMSSRPWRSEERRVGQECGGRGRSWG